jgi:ureidoacrylate peracid hydrolase
MHDVKISQEIIDRVMLRRKRFHIFDKLTPGATALVVIDMQNTFCAPGAPAEVPASRGICANINRLGKELRRLGGKVAWVTHATSTSGGMSDWAGFFDVFVADDIRQRTIESMHPSGQGQKIWSELETEPDDIFVVKNRYSALISGSSQLERILRSHGIENILIAGTKTNVCCESTARDGMMLDFRVVMISDCTAALSDREHLATLENVIQQFGDVLTTDETIQILR